MRNPTRLLLAVLVSLPLAAHAQDAEPAATPAPETAGTAEASGEVSAGASADLSADASASAEPSDGGGDSWSFGIAPRVCVTVPTSKLGVMVLGGLELDVALPVLQRRLVVAVDATYTRPSHSGSGTDPRVNGAYDYEVTESELKVSLDLVFRFFTAERRLVPFVGAGPLAQFLKTNQTTTLAPGENTETSTEFGVELLGGIDYRLGPGMLVVDARLIYSNLDHLFTGDSNAGNVTFGLGYRFVF